MPDDIGADIEARGLQRPPNRLLGGDQSSGCGLPGGDGCVHIRMRAKVRLDDRRGLARIGVAGDVIVLDALGLGDLLHARAAFALGAVANLLLDADHRFRALLGEAVGGHLACRILVGADARDVNVVGIAQRLVLDARALD